MKPSAFETIVKTTGKGRGLPTAVKAAWLPVGFHSPKTGDCGQAVAA